MVKQLLIVDDDSLMRRSLSATLDQAGYATRTAASAADALHAVHLERPDLVLLDIGLPGLDGYEVAARLRQDPATAGARLVALTGYGHDEARNRALEAGFDAHFAKPVAVGALLSGAVPRGMFSRDSGA